MVMIKKYTHIGFSLVLLVFCSFFSGQEAFAKTSIETITAKGLINKITTEGKGKVVVVNIFASWCAPCREEVPGLIAVRDKFSDKELLLIGVSVDKPAGKMIKSAKSTASFCCEPEL